MVVTPSAIVSWGSGRDIGGALFANASPSISLVDDALNPLSGQFQSAMIHLVFGAMRELMNKYKMSPF